VTAATSPLIRTPQPQGQPWRGPIQFGDGRMAEHMVQVGYNAQHKVPWHWPVPAYLTTKAIGAGIFLVLGLGWVLDLFPFDGLTAVVGGFLSLLFIALTTGLLVADLEKPERFLYIVFRPQWRSWLARGAVILIGFSTVAGLWWLLETLAYCRRAARRSARIPHRAAVAWAAAGLARRHLHGLPLCPGRRARPVAEPPAAAAPGGAGAHGRQRRAARAQPGGDARGDCPRGRRRLCRGDARRFVHDLAGEFGVPHASEVAARAAHEISHGHYRRHFWGGSIGLGHVVPLLLMLLWPVAPAAGALAGLAAIAGLYLFEYAFVMAPQEVPNS
jgi:formate-dependent nitrite reductase membrane component NrfD